MKVEGLARLDLVAPEFRTVREYSESPKDSIQTDSIKKGKVEWQVGQGERLTQKGVLSF